MYAIAGDWSSRYNLDERFNDYAKDGKLTITSTLLADLATPVCAQAKMQNKPFIDRLKALRLGKMRHQAAVQSILDRNGIDICNRDKDLKYDPAWHNILAFLKELSTRPTSVNVVGCEKPMFGI
eukprot:g78259.t1